MRFRDSYNPLTAKNRWLFILILAALAIYYLLSGLRPVACNDQLAHEALVIFISEHLEQELGPGQTYELTVRSDNGWLESETIDGYSLCRAAFDYRGPLESGPMVLTYRLSPKLRRGQIVLEVTGLDKSGVRKTPSS